MEFLTKLSDLAALTAGRLPFASALMEAQVKQRQKDYTNHNREIAEVLVSDVINLIAGLNERKDEDDEEGESSDDDNDGDEDESRAIEKLDQDELYHLQGDEGQMDEATPPRNASQIGHLEITHEGDRASTTHDPVENETNIDRPIKREASPAATPPSKRRQTAPFTPQSLASTENRETRETIASLRASAARLHQQAAQREAEAYRLEAEMFAREAGDE